MGQPADQLVDGADHEVGLVGDGRRRVAPDQRRLRVEPGRVEPPAAHQRRRRDRLHGGGQDRRRRAVVAGQPDQPGVGEVLREAQEEADVGAAERVDRLVRVADRAEVAVGRAEQPQQLVLHRVDVLVLVDEDPPPPLPVPLDQRPVVRAAARTGRRHQLVQVDQVLLAQQRARTPRRRRRPRRAGRRALGVVGDPEARRQPGRRGVLPQDRQPQRVERGDRDVLGDRAEQPVEPVPQLLGGPPGEGDRQACSGKTSSSAQRYAMRWVSVRVLPVPGPATISSGPPGADAATRCIASSRSSRPVPTSSIPASIGSNGSCGDGGGAIGGAGGGAGASLRRPPRRRRGRLAGVGGPPARRRAGALRRHGYVEQRLRPAGAGARAQLRRVEERDHAVLAVVAGRPGDLAAPQPADRPRRAAPRRPGRSRPAARWCRISSSGPSAATSVVELPLDRLRLRADAVDLAEDLGQRDQVGDRAGRAPGGARPAGRPAPRPG